MQLSVWDISLITSFRLRETERFKCNTFKKEIRYSGLQMILEQAGPDMQIFPNELFLKKEHADKSSEKMHLIVFLFDNLYSLL